MNNFICKNKIGIWIVCLCLVIGCIWKTDYTYAKEDTGSSHAEVKLEVVIGYDGNQVRYARKNRAVVTVINDSSEPIDGVATLSLPAGSEDGITVVKQQVHIEPREEVEVDLSFVSSDIFHTVTVCLEDMDGKTIAQKATVVKKLRSSELVYGILSKNPDSLTYFSKENYGKDVVFEKKDFPDRKDWLDILDVLLVGECNLQTLNQEQRVALTDWVKDGGTVVIGNTGEESVENLNILDIKAEETKNGLLVTGVDGTYYNKADLTIYPVEYGRGCYVVCSKSLEFANTELVKKSACVAAAKEYYGETAEFCLYPDYTDEGFYGESSAVVDKDHFPLLRMVAMFLMVYILLITVVLRLVLKRKDKLEYMWGLIPLFAITFMGILYAIGAHSRVSSVQMSYYTVVEYEEDSDTGKAKSCVSLVNPNNQTYEVNIPDGMEVWNADACEEMFDLLEKDIRKEVKIDKGNGIVTFSGNTSFEKNNLYGTYEVKKTGEYDSSITCNNYEFQGSFTNQMGVTMKNACFLAGKRIYYVGDIKDGETVALNGEQKHALLYNVTDLYESSIQARKWLSFGQKQEKYGLGYGYLDAIYNYLNSYSSIQRVTEPKMIYVTEKESEINKQWGVEDMVGYTVNVLNIDVDYRQGEDTFVCDLLSSKYVDQLYNFVDNDNSIDTIITCQFGENETLSGLKYLEAPNDFGKDEQILVKETQCHSFDGKIELYNYDTAAFETVFVQTGQELTRKELASYIGDDNKIRIRLIVDVENPEGKYIYEYVPIISATIKEAK